MRRLELIVVALTFSTAGCGPSAKDPTPAEPVVRQDSAGIAIVQYGPDVPPGVARWRLEPQPALEIGKDDQSVYELVHVNRASWSPNGDIVAQVSDGRTFHELRAFDSSGTFLWRFGRPGPGPGEFRNLFWWASAPGDSLTIWDNTAVRATIIDPSGKLARDYSLAGFVADRIVYLAGTYANGAVAVRVRPSMLLPPPPGYSRDTETVALIPREAGPLDTIARWPGTGRFTVAGSVYSQGLGYNPLAVAARDSMLVHGDGDRFEIHVYTPLRRLRRIIRWARPLTRPTPATVAKLTDPADWKDEKFREGDKGFLNAYREWLPTATYPAHQRVHLDERLNIWVEDFYGDGGPNALPLPNWTIFDSTGTMIAIIDVNLPGFTPWDFRSDQVLGTAKDSSDMEHLRVHRIAKTAQRSAPQ